MVRTVHKHVTTNVMDVTTLMVPVIKGVNRDGTETTVNNVTCLNYTIIYFFYEINLKTGG